MNRTLTSFRRKFSRGRAAVLTAAAFIMTVLLVTGCARTQSPPKTPPEVTQQSEQAAPTLSDDPLQPAPQPDLTALKTIESPSPFHTLTQNPIVIRSTQTEIPDTLWKSTFIIEGLRDDQVQSAINQDLSSLFDALEASDPPPYRGIYQRVPPGSDPVRFTLNATAPFNFENLLSVVVYADKTYTIRDPEAGERTEFIGRIETRTYDLRTGEPVPLPALFATPSTAMSRINDEVQHMLSSQHADEEPDDMIGMFWIPRLTQPFKGLSANQKYYLQPGGITLIFDHQTPEFDIGLYPAQITLPYDLFEGELAIRERFADRRIPTPAAGTSLYLDSGPRDRQFVQNDHYFTQSIVAGSETGFNPAVNTVLNYRYPESLPLALQSIVSTLLDESRHYLKDLQSTDTAAAEKPYADILVDLSRVGPYYTLRHSIYTQIGTPGATPGVTPGVRPAKLNSIFTLRQDLPGITESMPSYFASFFADGREITLERCFTPGFDYKAALARAYNAQAQQSGSPELNGAQLEHVIFSINCTGFECYFPTLDDQGYDQSYVYLPFSDVGAENLTIFGE